MDQATLDFFDKMKALTGKSKEEITELYVCSGLNKHSEIRSFFMEQLQLSYGYANTLVHMLLQTDGASMAFGKEMEAILSEIYNEKKSQFRPIHDALMTQIHDFGEFEILPKKGYLSLKRKTQFAMIGPKTNTRMEIGINLKGIQGTTRLIEQPKGSMCKFIVKVERLEDIDEELINWLREAFIQSE